MAKKFTIRTVGRVYSLGPQILKLEKKCFGWHCEGREKEVVDDGYTATDHGSYVSVKHNTKLIKYIYFSRPCDYKKNILFSLLEFISNILSRIRVWAINLIVIAIIVAAIFYSTSPQVTQGIAIIYAALILGSIVVALLGLLVRKVFKLDEKTDQYYAENGYKKWSDYEENE